MAFNLPSAVYTPQLLQAVDFEVERLRAWMSDSAIKRKVGATPGPEPSHSTETQLVLDSWLGGKVMNVTQLTELIGQLRALKPVTVYITLAALPGETLRLHLVQWFRANCRDDVLINFSADRTIGGGIIIRTPNRIFDYSFRQRLVDGRLKLPEIIRNVR